MKITSVTWVSWINIVNNNNNNNKYGDEFKTIPVNKENLKIYRISVNI